MTTMTPAMARAPPRDVVVIDLSDDDELVTSNTPISVPPVSTPAANEGDTGDPLDDESHDGEGSVTSDIIEAGQDPNFDSDDVEACTEEETQAYRKRVREIGISPFIQETVTAGAITAKKLCTAFGVRLPMFMRGEPDENYLRILGKAILREIRSREKLPQYNTFDDAVALLQKSRNIMVITGAGISTNLGVPDFRSKNTGFYDQMRAAGFSSPEEIFDIFRFEEDPNIFYTYAVDTFPKGGAFSPTHAFIRLLQDRNKLLTNYTQNIDNLEEVAGISQDRLIQCHGSWGSATCLKCKYNVRIAEIESTIRAKQIPRCMRCIADMQTTKTSKRKRGSSSKYKLNKARKRSDDDSDENSELYTIDEPGVMKPDITFFGEALPKAFFERVRDHDLDRVDMVIVIGTSMQVAPVSEIPRVLKADVPQIYISRDPCKHINFDITLLGDCDIITAELARRAGWSLKHHMLQPGRRIDIKPNEEGLPATWQIT